MSKPPLGKGLGELMNGDQVAGKERPAASGEKIGGRAIGYGRGLNTLVAPKPAGNDISKGRTLPAWFFFAVDILLLANIIAITFNAPRPFDFWTLIFCAVSAGLGCLLSLAGVMRIGE